MACKTLYCKGNLKSGYISVAYSPTLELSRGVHEIRVQTVLFDLTNAPESFGKPVGIALNFVKAYEFSQTKKKFEYIFSPLNICALEPSTAHKFEKTFEPTWTVVNNLSDELRIFVRNLETNEPLICDCNVYVTILFRRIQ
jgi:hypothetical protein